MSSNHMEYPNQSDQSRKFLLVLVAAVVPFAAATTLLLTSILGPSDFGVSCTRERGVARCEVIQTRLLGFAGNSSFPIPESQIAGARAACAHGGVGGRGGPSCSVELLLKSGPYRIYPVLSYPFIGQAESSARELNEYFADPARPSIALKDKLGSTVLIFAGGPMLIVAALLALMQWRRAMRQSAKQGVGTDTA